MRNWAGNLGTADSMNGTVFPDFDQTEKTRILMNKDYTQIQCSHLFKETISTD